jgi:hypothetical protein
MKEPQSIVEIPAAELLANVQRMQASGWRLVQICCTRLASDHEVGYSFDRGQMAEGPAADAEPRAAEGAPAAAEGGAVGAAAADAAQPGLPAGRAATEAPAGAGPADARSPEPRFVTLRVRLPLENPELPSVSSFFWSAFLYENEMHDLFGVNVKGMALDFHGKLYTTAVPAPYSRKDA